MAKHTLFSGMMEAVNVLKGQFLFCLKLVIVLSGISLPQYFCGFYKKRI